MIKKLNKITFAICYLSLMLYSIAIAIGLFMFYDYDRFTWALIAGLLIIIFITSGMIALITQQFIEIG